MARIRYLAVLSQDPVALASFYTRHFAMKELGRSPEGDVTLTDGGFNMTLFQLRADLYEPHLAPGFHHLGIAVDSVAETEARYLELYPRGTVVRESGDLAHGDIRIHDPESNPVTISETGFGLAADVPATPRLAHLALNALDTDAVCDFYMNVFGFRELFAAHAHRRSDPNYRNRHVGDGYTNVAIQVFYNDEPGHEARFGIAHMGFIVKDSAETTKAVEGEATITRRPSTRTQSEARMRDPEGNACDLSGRGWEVDTDSWASAVDG
jgi:catechol 2,3-dioxygenase-like lactoylglutathione lyase family enzyme